MTHPYRNVDRSFKFEPMISRQLKVTRWEQKLADYKIFQLFSGCDIGGCFWKKEKN